MKIVVIIIVLSVLCCACKQRVFEYEEYGNENESGKEWHIRYFVTNPPRDTIECLKMFITYADSLGLSLDSLKNGYKILYNFIYEIYIVDEDIQADNERISRRRQ